MYFFVGAVSTQQYRYHRDSNARVRVVYFDLLNCSGDEAALLSCPHNIALAYCSYVNDVGAICRGKAVVSLSTSQCVF